jgi:hypothetical protein
MDGPRNKVCHTPVVHNNIMMCRLFFEACKAKAAAPEIMGRYRTEYDWISSSILKSRTPQQVRRFAEKLFNQQRIEWDGEGNEESGANGSDSDDEAE